VGAKENIFTGGMKWEKAAEKLIIRSSIVCSLYQIAYCQCYQIKEDKITEQVARMWEIKVRAKFCLGSLKGRYNLEDLGVGGRIILKHNIYVLGK
jgi:hypothetical protein